MSTRFGGEDPDTYTPEPAMSEPRLVKFIVPGGIIESTELIDGNYVYAVIPSYVYLAADVDALLRQREEQLAARERAVWDAVIAQFPIIAGHCSQYEEGQMDERDTITDWCREQARKELP